jgi:hypothetical protein
MSGERDQVAQEVGDPFGRLMQLFRSKPPMPLLA